MGVISWIASKLGTRTPAPSPTVKRGFAAAGTGRLLSGWTTTNLSANAELRNSLPLLRARSRDLARNNDYVRRYLELVRNNVVGPNGINLQIKGRGGDGKLYREGNRAVEEAFRSWCRRGVCDSTGLYSFIDMQQAVINAWAQDGEVLVQLLYGNQAGNKFNFALRLIEADHLDDRMTDQIRGINMGVELTQTGKPVAYHLFNHHPGENGAVGERRTERYPATSGVLPLMLHVFRPERPGQIRGIPRPVSAMTRLNMLGGYEEAALVNARNGASKMGIYTRSLEATDGYSGDSTDVNGNPVNEVEPGMMETLPPGWDFKPYDPTYPSGEFEPFMKRVLKGAASGLGVSYVSLANDLEGVSYSSIRQGVLEDRDQWRTLQGWFIEAFIRPVFEAWLWQALGTGQIVLNMGKRGPNSRPTASKENFDKFNAPVFQPRGWEWVDPLKDQKAVTEAIANRITSRTRVLAAQGEDFEDLLVELAAEHELAEEYGIELEVDNGKTGTDTADSDQESGSDNDDDDASGETDPVLQP